MAEPVTVSFEVLFRTRGSGTTPTAATRENFRPEPDAVQATQHWLEAHGAACHATGFSLACTAPVKRFRSLFGSSDTPRVPQALAPWVEAISVPPPPDLF